MDQARAFWITGPGRGELRAEPLGAPALGEARVRAVASGISRGTEALVLAGRVPPAVAAEMRAPRMAGDFGGAVKYGYASVGEVEAGPAELVGRRVFCLHPHQDRYMVPAEALAPLPEALPARRAVLAANVETAVNALWDGAPGVGDRVAVVGGGTVGLCCALLAARIPGVKLTLFDLLPSRRALAESLGVAAADPDRAPPDLGADLVIHASGRAAGLAMALALAGVEAMVLELSWYGDGDVPLPLGGAFHPRRLRLCSSQVGLVAASHRPRWSHRRRLELALALLAEDDRFDALLSPPGTEIPFAELPTRWPALAARPGEGPPTPVVVY